jgi:cytochrome c551/c552
MRRTPTRLPVAIAVAGGVSIASLTGVFTAAQSTAPSASIPRSSAATPRSAAQATPAAPARRADATRPRSAAQSAPASASPPAAGAPASATAGGSARQQPSAARPAGQTRGIATAAASAGAPSQLATIQQYCVGCHNDRAKTAGVSFDGLTADGIGQRAELFEKAVRKVRGRVMPPPGARQPEAAAADSLVTWLEQSLDSAAGRAHLRDEIVLHRLNRKEYANAVRDLLAVDVDATDLLPADDVVDGFDNIATALQVSPSFIEQYVTAARAVAVKAVGRPDARPGGWTFRAGPGTQLTHVAGLPLGTRGGILAKVDLPSDGEYVVNIADIAGGLWGNGMEYENPLVVTLDNKVIYETVVGGEDDAKVFDQVLNGAIDRVNARLKNIRFSATAGPHRIGVAFRRRTFAESDDQLQMFAPGGGQDRMYRVSSFQILGPFSATGLTPTPSRSRIFICRPKSTGAQAGCARQIITSLATRAYRRPASADDVKELFAYYEEGAKDGGFEGGIRSAVTGMLASPFFLYRSERVPAGVAPGAAYAITDLELASKLSFFLWNTIPDDTLLKLATAGTLHRPAVLDQQVRRMLTDARSATLASNFVHQWLDMKRLDEIVPDAAVFPYASGRADPRDDFRTELTLFADSLFREDRSVADLLRATHTYLNERVALHYGITDVKGERFRRVELAQSARWGLLGKGAVLMAAAYPNRTSPVLRGAFVLKHIQGVPPATPPPNIPTLDEKDIGTPKALTVREMIAKHRANPSCASCHAVMDPLGLALENFDATGMWRDRDRYAGAAIDASGVLPDGTPVTGPDDLRKALLRRPEQFAQTFTEGLLAYATGRKLEYYDMPTVRRIVRGAATVDYRFSALVQAVVRSEQFTRRRAPQVDKSSTQVAAASPRPAGAGPRDTEPR